MLYLVLNLSLIRADGILFIKTHSWLLNQNLLWIYSTELTRHLFMRPFSWFYSLEPSRNLFIRTFS